jgi:hypothetical protein
MINIRQKIATIICICCIMVYLPKLDSAQAETPQGGPPFVQFQHGSPSTQLLAPAKKLWDVAALPGVPKLTFAHPNGSGGVHMMPTVAGAAARAKAAGPLPLSGGPLVYHGGNVMNPYVAVYDIFWAPPSLQNGGATGFSPLYGTVQALLGAWYTNHGLGNIATQYFQTVSGTTTYFMNNGGLGGFYVDRAAYPASGCTDSATPGNCLTDSQIQTEIQKVMTINGWTGGLNKIFVLYTSSGEGSCFEGTTQCAYTTYCAYHGYFASGATTIIYANIPYGGNNACELSGQTSPNGDLAADGAANPASHEITEAATDPFLSAWFDASGNEIGDICNFNFGTNTWAGPSAMGNQMWNGMVFELQQEYSNHTTSCLQVGP